MNIALYGGSFDPPHIGHIAVVDVALKALDIEKLIVIPAFVNPFKSGTHAPADLRLRWLQKIFASNRHVEVSDFETRQGRAVKSIETVRHFAELYGHVYFIIGADNLAALKQWHQYEALDELVTWVVASRDHIEIDAGFIQLAVTYPLSSTQLREQPDETALPEAVAQEIRIYYENNKEDHARTH